MAGLNQACLKIPAIYAESPVLLLVLSCSLPPSHRVRTGSPGGVTTCPIADAAQSSAAGPKRHGPNHTICSVSGDLSTMCTMAQTAAVRWP